MSEALLMNLLDRNIRTIFAKETHMLEIMVARETHARDNGC